MHGGNTYSGGNYDYPPHQQQQQLHQEDYHGGHQVFGSSNVSHSHSFGASQGQSYVAASQQHQSSYYDSDSRQIQQRPHGNSFGSSSYAAPPPPPQAYYPPPPRNGPARSADEHAMDIALLISQQEAQYGISMYDSLTPADQPEIDAMMARGYSNDEAIQVLFDRRYNRNGAGTGGFGPPPAQQQLQRGGSGNGFGYQQQGRTPQQSQFGPSGGYNDSAVRDSYQSYGSTGRGEEQQSSQQSSSASRKPPPTQTRAPPSRPQQERDIFVS